MKRETTNFIVIHCSDSDISEHDNIDVIRVWHLERGFSDVGYHYFIKNDGTIQEGRHHSMVAAHCYGQNKKSIGICLSGRYSFTDEQFKSLHMLIIKLWGKYGEDLPVFGHYDFSKKTCPNFDVSEFLTEYNLNKE